MVPQWLIRVLMLVLVVVASISASGCEVVGDIFKAGVWVGALFIVIIIAIVGFIAAKIRG
jgi:uncharacterized membrane protein YkvI